jgi:hypothetical protein
MQKPQAVGDGELRRLRITYSDLGSEVLGKAGASRTLGLEIADLELYVWSVRLLERLDLRDIVIARRAGTQKEERG